MKMFNLTENASTDFQRRMPTGWKEFYLDEERTKPMSVQKMDWKMVCLINPGHFYLIHIVRGYPCIEQCAWTQTIRRQAVQRGAAFQMCQSSQFKVNFYPWGESADFSL